MDDNIITSDKSGEIRVSSEVISVIAGMTVSDIEGVFSLIEDENTKAYSKRMITKGITIDYNQDEITVSVNIIIKYGYDISEVCREVQLKIKDALENMIGFRIKTIDVVVAGVHTGEQEAQA